MLEFFREGGFGMFPVLGFGLALIVVAALYARDGARPRLAVIGSLAALLVATVAHAMLSNVAAVFWFVQDPERVEEAALTRIVFTGLMESTRPGVLGGALLVFALVLTAVGAQRGASRELRLGAA